MISDSDLKNAIKQLGKYCKEHKSNCSTCLIKDGCNRLHDDSDILEASKYLSNIVNRNLRKSKERNENKMSDARKKPSITVQNKELGVVMDLVDVRDELNKLKLYYEDLVHYATTNETRYHASYSAVALAEACNVITYYLKDRSRIPVKEVNEDEEI